MDSQKDHGLKTGGFQTVALALAPRPFVFNVAAHIRFKHLQEFHRLSLFAFQTWCPGTIHDCLGATITLARGVEIPGVVF
eukprot:1594501-Pyramimonas_sp.AAC.1